MSVALLIKHRDRDTVLVPIATEATYRSVWQAGATALELDWVEAMQSGIKIRQDDLPEILFELRMLRAWFEASSYSSQSERLDRVVDALKAVSFGAGETASIG